MPRGSISRAWVDLEDPLNLTTRGHIRAMGFTDYDMGRPDHRRLQPLERAQSRPLALQDAG